MKKVSVIIPNYNHCHYLGSAIQSVLAQTFSDYEIIVVDDGSTDNSREVVSSFGEKVHYIWQENKGLGGARNTGILASTAEFVGFLDADDEWEPTYLERMVQLSQKYPEAVVYYCCAQGIDESGNQLPQVFGQMVAPGDVYQNLLRANFIIPSTVMARRSTVVEKGLFEQDNLAIHGCEDWDLWLRLAPHNRMVGTSERLVRYRQHQNTFSAHPEKMQKAVKAVIEKHFGLDEGDQNKWSPEKKRAYGGVYRYASLTAVQTQDDWKAASQYLKRAIEIDPNLVEDLDLFYELAFGKQPPGHKGTNHKLELEQNIVKITELLKDSIGTKTIQETHSLRRKLYGTSNFAIGLAAYNSSRKRISRKYLLRSLYYRPELVFEPRIIPNFLKTYINTSWIGWNKTK